MPRSTVTPPTCVLRLPQSFEPGSRNTTKRSASCSSGFTRRARASRALPGPSRSTRRSVSAGSTAYERARAETRTRYALRPASRRATGAPSTSRASKSSRSSAGCGRRGSAHFRRAGRKGPGSTRSSEARGEAHDHGGTEAPREPQGFDVLRRAASVVPANRDPLGDERQARRDARPPARAAHQGQRGGRRIG